MKTSREILEDEINTLFPSEPCRECMAGILCRDCCVNCSAMEEYIQEVNIWIGKNPEIYFNEVSEELEELED